ncbi:RelA/SpoT domain-containing protein [Sphingomonas sp. FW199]|uniref:RelA/SpoT domain-containing protein n=1 Tax=Sphingomonas sp. FW199 TaxID=3400217 RepID=UPI003CF23F8F
MPYMSTYPPPPKSKREVNRAGKAIGDGKGTEDDKALVDQWRASHGYVINTFQIFFKRRIQKINSSIEFAQRLKRRHTVIDKITRRHPDGRPLMSDVTSMQDFAGCRLIFDTLEDLRRFRDYVHSSKSMEHVAHKLRHDPSKYDYIHHPKSSGYRGIHDVYAHHPRAHRRGRKDSEPWQGLLVEVQYRTRVQHAWATALEISDIVDGQKTKFDLNDSERVRFFALASEILARFHEGIANAMVDLETDALCKEFSNLERSLGILQRLHALKVSGGFDKFKRHNVLNVYKDDRGDLGLEIFTFSSPADAIEKASQLESDPDSLNAVYVRADNPSQVRSAYRNYFNDAIDFVKLVREALASHGVNPDL